MTFTAFKFELAPNNVQATYLAGHCRASKVAANWMLGQVKSDMNAKKLDPEHVSVGWSMPSLRKAWNQTKSDVYPDWSRYSKEAYASAATNVALALDAWSQSRKGVRKGPKVGFPSFKRRVDSYTVTTGVMGVNDRFHVRVPVVGVLRTKESTVKLLSALDDGRARILKATLSTRAGRWYISFAVDLDRKLKVPKNPNSVVGIDVGIKRLATVVNDKGDVVARVENPAPLKKNLRKLARLQRSLARRQKRTATRQASQRYKKQAKKVARLHFRVANVRNDACHKFTTGVMSQHGVNVVEKLNVAGMAKNRRLARAVADSGLGQIRLMCLSKKSRFDTTVVEADQWFPSSKLCSACGDKNTQLTLSDRKWVCQACGVLHDRDENAGLNLARYLATASAAGSAALNRKARGEGGRPNSVRRPSWKREARSPKKLQSGSASEVIGAHDPVPENDTKL